MWEMSWEERGVGGEGEERGVLRKWGRKEGCVVSEGRKEECMGGEGKKERYMGGEREERGVYGRGGTGPSQGV